MKTATLLHILMALHTLIGVIGILCLIYLPYAAWKRRKPREDRLLLLALLWPFLNLVVMAANGMACPLQNAAQALVGQTGQGWVRDIYLVPESWLGVVPWTYPIGYGIGVALVLWRSGIRLSRLTPGRHGRP